MAQLPAGSPDNPQAPWYSEITWYHWVVVIVASCGWLFDCMDQRIFALAREPALNELLAKGNAAAADAVVKDWIGWATASMMIGWATGGIIFGVMSDRLGRVKTMVVTLLIYSSFTGLSGISQSGAEFLIYRFLVGLGVGGMFGAATTLVAESVPGRFRAIALGSLQALSATGNILGSLLSLAIPPGESDFLWGHAGWRVIFFVGVVPAVLIVPIVLFLREPERWKEARRKIREGENPSEHAGSIPDLFRDPTWRRNTLVGVTLGLAGMAGLWGIAFFSPELITTALRGETPGKVDHVRGIALSLQDVGAFFGILAFTFVATRWGRKPAFAISYILCILVTILVFTSLNSETDAYWMCPLLGFASLSVFGGYSIYFPELFPTRLRGTGVGFCYNTVRYLTAGFPPMLMYLNRTLAEQGVDDPFRKSAVILSSVFILGLVALIWAPETKGQPLPE